MSKGHTSRSWPGDTNVDDKSNSLTARKRHLMWERKRVSATVLHGHDPVKFGLKKSVVLLKLLISFWFTDAERTEFADHFRGKVNLEKIPTAVPFSKEEVFGKDGGLPRICVPLAPHSCRKLMSPFLHVQSGKVSDGRACRAEAQGVICAGIYSIKYASYIWFKNIVYLCTHTHTTHSNTVFLPPSALKEGMEQANGCTELALRLFGCLLHIPNR